MAAAVHYFTVHTFIIRHHLYTTLFKYKWAIFFEKLLILHRRGLLYVCASFFFSPLHSFAHLLTRTAAAFALFTFSTLNNDVQ